MDRDTSTAKLWQKRLRNDRGKRHGEHISHLELLATIKAIDNTVDRLHRGVGV